MDGGVNMQIKHIRAMWFGSEKYGYSLRLDTITPKGQIHVALLDGVNGGRSPSEFTVDVFKAGINDLCSILRQRGIDAALCSAPSYLESCPPLSDEVAKAFEAAMV